MNDLMNTTEMVKAALTKVPNCRNSDSFLYLCVLFHIANKKGIDLHQISVPEFLHHSKDYGFPGFETVRRTRQKLQQHHPELSACETVDRYRAENEVEYRKYARGEV